MYMDFIDIVACSITVGAIILIGNKKTLKISNLEQYLLAGRKTGVFSLVATLVMTELNTGTLVAFSSMGYIAGIWSISLPLVFLVGLMFYSFTVAKYWRRMNCLTAAHYFKQRFGNGIGMMSAIFLFIAMAGFSATYIKSLSLMFAPFINLPLWVISILIVIIVLCFALKWGLIAVIRTDIYSFIMLLVAIPIIGVGLYYLPADNVDIVPTTIDQGKEIIPVSYVFSLIVLTMFSYILAPWYSQKLASASKSQYAKRAVYYSAIIIFLIYSLAIYSCYILSAKGFILDNPDESLINVIRLSVPTGLFGIVYGVLFCIGATTLTGVWNAMVSLLALFGTPSLSSRKIAMYYMFFCAVASVILSILMIDKLLDNIILANIPIVSLSFALLGGIYWKKITSYSAMLSSLVGFLGAAGCYIYFGNTGMYTWYWAVWVVPLIFITGFSSVYLFEYLQKIGLIMLRGQVKKIYSYITIFQR